MLERRADTMQVCPYGIDHRCLRCWHVVCAASGCYARARVLLISEISPRLKTVSPWYGQRVPLDNASLLARRVYARNLDLFDAVYAREGSNLRRAIGRIIGLAKASPDDPYGALARWLGAYPVTAG